MKLNLVKKNKVIRDKKDIDTIVEFVAFCVNKLGIEGDVKIILVGKHNEEMGMSTGGYDTQSGDILVREFGRSLVDICRSIAHELVHQRQDEKGKLVGDIPNIGGEIEDEANAICGQLVKMFVVDRDAKWMYTY